MLQDVSREGITKDLTKFEPSCSEARVLTTTHITVGYPFNFIFEVCSVLSYSSLSVSDRAL